MIESSDSDRSLREIEAMVRSAGNYVQVSKDLRPRVLEGARMNSGERRARRIIRRAALTAAVLAWYVTASVGRLDGASKLRELALTVSGSYPVSSSRLSSGTGDAAWALVDSYTEVRGRQADVLRLNP